MRKFQTINILLFVKLLLLAYDQSSADLISDRFSSLPSPDGTCSCKCSWQAGSSNATMDSDNGRRDSPNAQCSFDLGRDDLARIIDGRPWSMPSPATTANTRAAITTTLRTAAQTQATTVAGGSRTRSNLDPALIIPGGAVTTATPGRILSNAITFASRSSYSPRPSDYSEMKQNIQYLTKPFLVTYSQRASQSLKSFLKSSRTLAASQVFDGTGGPVQQRAGLNASEQQRLADVLVDLQHRQQSLMLSTQAQYKSAAATLVGGRGRRQAATPAGSCTQAQQHEACRLLELVKEGTLFLMPTIPDADITDQQNADSSAFTNVIDMCAGRMAKTLTQTSICIDPNVLNAIGTFSVKFFGETTVPLMVKSLAGGVFPVLSAGGSAAILHRYGVAVDFACGMFESQIPDACVRIMSMCSQRAKQLGLSSIFFSMYAENYGCGSTASYFDSVHCTLGVVDTRAMQIPPQNAT